jgi:glycosyltransferase involved in cell wall biosynthesis
MPSVSAILLCYNCEAFIAEAVRSVFAQDYGEPIEILISDDASTDDTFDRVRREVAHYRGPHRVRLNRQSTNSGSKSAHLNDVFPLASGDVLISFDGDDISENSRVRKIVNKFSADPRVQAVYSSFSLIDRFGRARGGVAVPHPPASVNTSAWFARVDAYAAGTTLAIRRAVVEKFARLKPEINEDIVLPFRASLLGEVAFIAEPLVRARRHAASLTADLDQFTSMKAYRARMHLGIERARRNVQSRLADIQAAEAMQPSRTADFTALRSIVHDSLAKAEMTAPLMGPSLAGRLSALFQLVRSAAYQEELVQHTCIALAPETYLRYKRFALGVRPERPGTAIPRPGL